MPSLPPPALKSTQPSCASVGQHGTVPLDWLQCSVVHQGWCSHHLEEEKRHHHLQWKLGDNKGMYLTLFELACATNVVLCSSPGWPLPSSVLLMEHLIPMPMALNSSYGWLLISSVVKLSVSSVVQLLLSMLMELLTTLWMSSISL